MDPLKSSNNNSNIKSGATSMEGKVLVNQQTNSIPDTLDEF